MSSTSPLKPEPHTWTNTLTRGCSSSSHSTSFRHREAKSEFHIDSTSNIRSFITTFKEAISAWLLHFQTAEPRQNRGGGAALLPKCQTTQTTVWTAVTQHQGPNPTFCFCFFTAFTFFLWQTHERRTTSCVSGKKTHKQVDVSNPDTARHRIAPPSVGSTLVDIHSANVLLCS